MDVKTTLINSIEFILKKLATTGGALILIAGFFSGGFTVGKTYEENKSVLTMTENNNKHYSEVIDLKKRIDTLEKEIKFNKEEDGKKEDIKRRH